MSLRFDRRQFLRSSGTAVATAMASVSFLPSRVFGANERLNVGVIGLGGRAAAGLHAAASQNVAAVCDVVRDSVDAAAKAFPKAKAYADYRQLLEQKDLDAVTIGTPDHHHAPPTVLAIKRGLHVYCEKPLTHTVEEARIVAKLAAKMKVATQMGTQNHEHPGYLRTVELIKSGAIGDVKEVHVMTDRPGRWWSQGVAVPTDKPAVPDYLAWDLWLGPAAERPYSPAYVPFKWRGWWDFGCGAIGDMAIHLMDPAFWALDLGGPVKVTSKGPPPHPASGPVWMETKFEFGQRGKLPPVNVFWYEGEAKPPAEIAKELPMNGSLFVGTKGRLAVAHDKHPKLLPEADFAGFNGPEPFLPKSPGHFEQWFAACKTGSRTGSNFAYAGPFTEVVLLGNVAYRTGKTIEYDPEKMLVTNDKAANDLLRKAYRKGWEVSES
ncbi:MAG: oxidoreductase [Planctomycetota bacterium]|nr:MAG: oxidoreductase [Planctomycetota bacterium]